jgi:hypothetical protein
MGKYLRPALLSPEGSTLPSGLPHARHLDDEDIERYCIDAPRGRFLASDAFNQDVGDSVEEHLLVCADCCARAEYLQDYADNMMTAAVDMILDRAWQESLYPRRGRWAVLLRPDTALGA